MNVSKLIETINVNNHDCSLLLVDPKPNMLEWLSSFYKGKIHEKYRLYYPEANHVVIIPKVDRFYEPGLLDDFINRMKPGLLRRELRRFQAKPEDFGYPITVETFDAFFTASIREVALLMSDFDLSVITSQSGDAAAPPTATEKP
ncbi:MAG: hypothetical protein WAJ99_05870 [Candidatus Sulfotelmatobacter sp.]